MYTVNYYDVIDQEVVLPDTTANVDIFGLLHLLERHSKASICIVSASIGNKMLDVPSLMRSLKFR